MLNNPPKVFIADDDMDIVNALVKRCSSLGLEVDTAYDASWAWRGIEFHEPDVVILDVEMPRGNGLSVREMMVNHERLKATPVIMLTGKTDEATVRRCHDLLCYYVPKGHDVWSRVEPILRELFSFDPAAVDVPHPNNDREPMNEVFRGPMDLMDSVFLALGSDENFLNEETGQESSAQPWVLCIDDDAELSHGLMLRLEQEGIGVERAFAGREGYRRAFTGLAQAIILDYEMPNGNGDYVLRRLKENPVTKDIPVLVLTGRKDKHLERKMFGLGASSFMTKPYDWHELRGELRKYFSSSCVFP